MKAYCTCTSNRDLVFKPTTVTDDLCDKCGYYAVFTSHYERFPRNKINHKGGIHGYRPLLSKPDYWFKLGKEVKDIARNET